MQNAKRICEKIMHMRNFCICDIWSHMRLRFGPVYDLKSFATAKTVAYATKILYAEKKSQIFHECELFFGHSYATAKIANFLHMRGISYNLLVLRMRQC